VAQKVQHVQRPAVYFAECQVAAESVLPVAGKQRHYDRIIVHDATVQSCSTGGNEARLDVNAHAVGQWIWAQNRVSAVVAPIVHVLQFPLQPILVHAPGDNLFPLVEVVILAPNRMEVEVMLRQLAHGHERENVWRITAGDRHTRLTQKDQVFRTHVRGIFAYIRPRLAGWPGRVNGR
jgi:hypothetical protein